MQGNASPQVGTLSSLTISDAIGTYPNYTEESGTTVTFDPAFPNVIEITGWPLSASDTAVKYGQSLWLFDAVNGKLCFGKWHIYNAGTLTLNCIEGYPKWDTSVSSGTAKSIPQREAKRFDQCSVRNTGATNVTVNGLILDNSKQYINIIREGNLNFPVIIDASSGGIAQVSNGLI